MARTFLFLATSASAWGEVVFARRIAAELRARGDRVVMLAPGRLAPLLRRDQFDRLGFIDRGIGTGSLRELIPQVAAAERSETLVLIDVTSVYMHLEGVSQDAGFVSAMNRAGLRVIGLDVWDQRVTDGRWGFGEGREWIHSAHARDVVGRLCPVPIVSPSAAGAYCALPPHAPPTVTRRRAARGALGLGAQDRLIMFPTAVWQLPEHQSFAWNQRLAAAIPALVGHLVDACGAACHLAHVGPTRFPPLDRLGSRYRYFDQMSPDRFEELIDASDLLLSLNAAATTISSALARALPVLLVVNSAAGVTADDVLGGREVSAPMRAWIEALAPVSPFRVWPMGLHAFLAPVLEGNPLVQALTIRELLDEGGVVESLATLLARDDVRHEALARAQVYCELVRGLPTASEVIDTLV